MKRIDAIWFIPIGIMFFLAVELFVFLPLFLLGLVVLPFLYWFASFDLDEKGLLHFENPLLEELFGNFEDGINPPWWAAKHPDKDAPYSSYLWFIRNPVTNMRRWPIVSTLPKKSVKWFGNVDEIPQEGFPGWFIAWQGPYVGFFYQTTTYRIWLGWKISPRDSWTHPPRDYRYDGIGLAVQWIRF